MNNIEQIKKQALLIEEILSDFSSGFSTLEYILENHPDIPDFYCALSTLIRKHKAILDELVTLNLYLLAELGKEYLNQNL